MLRRSTTMFLMCIAMSVSTHARHIRPADDSIFYLTFSKVTQPAQADIRYADHVTEQITLFMSDPSKSLMVQSVGVSGAPTFTITGNTCTNVEITATTSCEVDVSYVTDLGYTPIDLFISTDQGPDSIDAGVKSPAIDLRYSPSSVSFGGQALFTPVSTVITITNPNPGYTDVYNPFTLSGPDKMKVALDSNSTHCDFLAANATCQFTVTFVPVELGANTAVWTVPTNLDYSVGYIDNIEISIGGTGVQSSINADLGRYYNVVATVGAEGAPVTAGGLDGLGNVYPIFADTAETTLKPSGNYGFIWQREQFALGADGVANASANKTIFVPAGNYYGLSLLATAVFGPQTNQTIVLNYMDGSTSTVQQNFSDWKSPKFYANEGIALNVPARVTADGKSVHAGPYYLFGYTIPVDHTKQLASVALPPTRDVIALSMNLETTPRPVPVDLSGQFNMEAIRHDSSPTSGNGIDGYGNAISYEQLAGSEQSFGSLVYKIPAPNVPNAVENRTIALPSGNFSDLRLLGMGVVGQRAAEPFVVTYADGTTSNLTQSFSDWHYTNTHTDNLGFTNGLAGETNAILMPYRLNKDGTQHSGNYMIYQYDLALDPTKSVVSIALPKTRFVVVLGMALVP